MYNWTRTRWLLDVPVVPIKLNIYSPAPMGSSIRHNEILDCTAHLMAKASNETYIQPDLLRLTSEHFNYARAIIHYSSWLNSSANGFRVDFKKSFLKSILEFQSTIWKHDICNLQFLPIYFRQKVRNWRRELANSDYSLKIVPLW